MHTRSGLFHSISNPIPSIMSGFGRLSFLFLSFCLILGTAGLAQEPTEQLKKLINNGKIREAPNPVAAQFILSYIEGTLTPSDQDRFQRQIIESLQENLEVTMLEQASIIQDLVGGSIFGRAFNARNLAGMAAGSMLGGMGGNIGALPGGSPRHDPEQVKLEFEEKLAAPWLKAMASTGVLEALGHRDEVDLFYRRCIQNNFTVDWMQDRCVAGLVALAPQRAYEFLMSLVENPQMDFELMVGPQMAALIEAQESEKPEMPTIPELRDPGIRGLGRLLSGDQLSDTQKARIFSLFKNVLRSEQTAQNHQALAEALGSSSDPRARPLLEKLAGDSPTRSVRRTATGYLASVFHQQEAREQLYEYLEEDPRFEQLTAARHLVRIQDPRGLEWVRRSLIDGSARGGLEASLIQFLGTLKDPSSEQLLERIRKNEELDRWVRDWAALALLQRGRQGAFEQVMSSLESMEVELQTESVASKGAKRALKTGAKIGASLLAKALMENYLGGIGSLVHEATVGKALGTNDIGGMLRRVAGDFAMSELMRHRHNSQAEDQMARDYFFTVAVTLADWEHPEALKGLGKLLRHEDSSVRIRAAQSLTERSEPSVAALLQEAFEVDFGDDSSNISPEEIRAQILASSIGLAPQAEETQELKRSAVESKDASLQAMAWLAMTREGSVH